MNTHPFNIRYIVVHVILYPDWQHMSYEDKMQYHNIIMASGRNFPLRNVQPTDGCLDIAYVGSEAYAKRSHSLLALLLDKTVEHPQAQLVDKVVLYEGKGSALFASLAGCISNAKPAIFQFLKNMLYLRDLLYR